MKRLSALSLLFTVMGHPFSYAQADKSDVDVLQTQGFQVTEQSTLTGEFTGCDKGQSYPLSNGKKFSCEPVEKIHHAQFVILNNSKTGETRYVINDNEVDGELN